MTQQDHIQGLLDKYWQGNTSLSEEQELKAYYNSSEGHASPEAAYFKYLREEQSLTYTKTVQLPREHRVPWTRRILSIAAAVMITLASWWGISEMNKADHAKVTVDDPELALQITREAFALLNGKVNKSGDAVVKQLPQLEKTFVFKNL